MIYDVKTTGEYGADCAKGRAIAATVLRDMRANENPTLIGRVIAAMDGTAGGVRVGFCHALAERLI